jgi:hypothetical protein
MTHMMMTVMMPPMTMVHVMTCQRELGLRIGGRWLSHRCGRCSKRKPCCSNCYGYGTPDCHEFPPFIGAGLSLAIVRIAAKLPEAPQLLKSNCDGGRSKQHRGKRFWSYSYSAH